MRFHICAALTVVWLTRFYSFSRGELCIIVLCIGFVLAAEAFNTAAEAAADLASGGKESAAAKKTKDCAAGAVLISAAVSAVCGVILFWDREAIGKITAFFSGSVFAAASLAVWVTGCFLFVFGKKRRK